MTNLRVEDFANMRTELLQVAYYPIHTVAVERTVCTVALKSKFPLYKKYELGTRVVGNCEVEGGI